MTTHSPAPGTPQTDHKARAAGNAAGPLGGATFILTALAMHYLGDILPAVFGTDAAMVAVSGVVGGIVAYGAARIRAYQVPNQPLTDEAEEWVHCHPLAAVLAAAMLLGGCTFNRDTAEVLATIALAEIRAEAGDDLTLLTDEQRARAARYCGYAAQLADSVTIDMENAPDVTGEQVKELCAFVDEAT